MGRELRRVPLVFTWPLHVPWKGFINPFSAHRSECPACGGSGSSPWARELKGKWYGEFPFKPEDRGSVPFTPDHPVIQARTERNGGGYEEALRLCQLFNSSWCHHLNALDVAALIEKGRLYDFTHTWRQGDGWQPKEPAYVPTPAEVNEWSLSGFGHDSINQWVVVNAECARLGVPAECALCQGTGDRWESPELAQQAKDWTPTDPPEGDGYQMWETVSEGSPISPVFRTPEELATYLAKNPMGADRGTSYDAWLAMIQGPGSAPTLIGGPGGVVSGVQGIMNLQ